MGRFGIVCCLLANSSSYIGACLLAPRPTARRGAPVKYEAPSLAKGMTMVVWSNSQAVEDYQALLAGRGRALTVDCPSVIIGAGSLGTALAALGRGDDVILRRGGSIPETLVDSKGQSASSFPIYVCVPNDELESAIKAAPDDRREDLVFVQRGCVEPLLKRYGLGRKDTTQLALLATVAAAGGGGGSRFVDGVVPLGEDAQGQPKFAGVSGATGKWAGAVVERLERGGLRADILDFNDWRRVMYEALIGECTFNLVGALHDCPPVEEVARYYKRECEDMLENLAGALRGTYAVTMLPGYDERLLAYAQSPAVARQTTGVTLCDFPWRHKIFYDISKLATSKGWPDPCDMHTEYLEYGREEGLFEIPE